VNAAETHPAPGVADVVRLEDVVAERSIVVCCGSGGVGKTTIAAVVGIASTRLIRAKVLTRLRAVSFAAASPGRSPSTTCMAGHIMPCTRPSMTRPSTAEMMSSAPFGAAIPSKLICSV